MKRKSVFLAVLVVVIVALATGGMIYLFLANNSSSTAKQDFDQKLTENWKIVTGVANNIQIQTTNTDTLVHFARQEYPNVQGIHFANIAPEYKEQAEEFQNEVSAPMIELLREIADGVKDSNYGKILRQAQSTDDGMKRFYQGHPGVIKPESIASLLEKKRKRIVKVSPPPPVQQATTKIIVMNYPDWVHSQEQKQAYDSMRSIAHDYFAERSRMQKVINWQYGSQHNEYFITPGIRERLAEGIQVRMSLLNRLSSVESVEGMSDLSSGIKAMLNNSIQSLSILRNNGDYPRFKYLNNQNDRIQTIIRRQFGIR